MAAILIRRSIDQSVTMRRKPNTRNTKASLNDTVNLENGWKDQADTSILNDLKMRNKKTRQIQLSKGNILQEETPRFKTSKKPSLNLLSPKLHSRESHRLPNTSRKLLHVSSATNSINSDISVQNQENTNDITLSNVNAKSKRLKKSHSPSKKLKGSIKRLSKSPKIVLRKPKSKLKHRTSKMKSTTKERNSSVPKNRKISNKNVLAKVSKLTDGSGTTEDSTLSIEESDLDKTLININLSAQYEEIISKKPRVVLERITRLDKLGKLLKTRNEQCPMDTTLDVTENAKKLHTNRKSNDKDSSSSFIVSTPNRKFTSHLNDTFFLNVSPEAASSPVINKSECNGSPFILTRNANRKDHNISVKNDERKSTNEEKKTKDNHNDTTIIADMKIGTADETYELFEPRTPRLKRECKKRSLVNMDIDNNTEIRKASKVRFTTPNRRANKLQTTLTLANKSTKTGTPTATLKAETFQKHFNNNIVAKNTPLAKRIANKGSNSRLNSSSKSVSSINVTPYNNKKRTKKTSLPVLNTSGTQRKGGSRQNITIQSTKKIPNFAKLHMRLFDKMESLVDNKKRLAKQHEALKTPKVLRTDKSNKPISSEKMKGDYNRFGFKLRKAEATNIVLRKHADVRQEKLEETKAFLKGVRTNRRFELQMKMRQNSH